MNNNENNEEEILDYEKKVIQPLETGPSNLDLEHVYTEERWECPECNTPGALFVRGKFEYCPICSSEKTSD